MFYYYRISDNSYQKEKLPGIGKKECLLNFLQVFDDWNGIIVADNCKDETVSMVKNLAKEYSTEIIETNLSNAGSLKFCIDHAVEHSPSPLLYFVEDDYLHNPKVKEAAMEATTIAANVDYATLYDHPDKYTKMYNYGETSKVYRKNNYYWRLTQSTTMTFITSAGTLRRDYDIWNKHISNTHPNDHAIFSEILKVNESIQQGKLACAIPGMAVHTDLTHAIQNFNLVLEPWAIEMASKALHDEICFVKGHGEVMYNEILKNTKEGSWEEVMKLSALLQTDLSFWNR